MILFPNYFPDTELVSFFDEFGHLTLQSQFHTIFDQC